MKKKVLFLTNIPAPYTVAFFEQLNKKVELTVAFERKYAEDRDLSWRTQGEFSFNYIILKSLKCGADFGLSFSIISVLKQKFDCIVVGNYSSPTGVIAIGYMHLHNMNFYIHADGAFISSESFLKKTIKRKLISAATGYISPSVSTDEFFKYYGKENAPIYRYFFSSISQNELPSKIFASKERFAQRKESRFFNNEKHVVLFVGSIIDRKGVDILVRAAKFFEEDTGVYVIGGNATAELERIIMQNEINNVHFIPFLQRGEILKCMSEADIFVFPTRYDIWGLVINEALSQGLPVITTTTCGAGVELINNDYNGYLIEPENIEEIVSKVAMMCKNEDLLYRLSCNAFESAKEYTIEKMVEQYAGIINLICGS